MLVPLLRRFEIFLDSDRHPAMIFPRVDAAAVDRRAAQKGFDEADSGDRSIAT